MTDREKESERDGGGREGVGGGRGGVRMRTTARFRWEKKNLTLKQNYEESETLHDPVVT